MHTVNVVCIIHNIINFRKWLHEHHKLDFIIRKTKGSKQTQSLLRRFTVSRRTWLVQQESITQSEVSIFDERRKTVANGTVYKK